MDSRKKNFFGLPIFSPFDVFKKPELESAEKLIKKQLQSLEQKLELRSGSFKKLTEKIKQFPIAELGSLEDRRQECEILDVLKSQSTPIHSQPTVKNLLNRRAQRIAERLYLDICRHFGEDNSVKLLDLGCGQGIIGQELLKKETIEKMALADIVDYRYSEVRQDPELSFHRVDPYRHNKIKLPFPIDGIILHTVLHHTSHPDDLIIQCINIFDNRPGFVIIVESGVGIELKMLGENASADEVHFSELTFLQQMAYTIFMDWFFCRIISDNINLTYNFNEYQGARCWESYFNEIEKLEILSRECLGFMPDCTTSFHTKYTIKVN